ncbi:MAG: TIR domain-containing protein [Bacteroidales bacterium]|nr:TIR domain-containing protein [Bacteroidales bacterium]
MPKIFISHSWEDNDIARKLADDLKRDGVDIWIDYSRIEGGQSLPEVIGEAIKDSEIVILMWSIHASKSRWVRLEWNCAIGLDKKIIPCIMDRTELPPILSSLLYHNFQEYDNGYRFLSRDIKLATQRKSYEKKELGTTNAIESNKIPVYHFRTIPLEMYWDEVKKMLKDRNYYDSEANKKGTGIKHFYEKKILDDNDVILDQATQLMWQKSGSIKRIKYQEALDFIKNINNKKFAGFSDWRLPTLEEAMSLMEFEQKNDDLYIDPIFGADQRYIWTCDKVRGEESGWIVYFDYGRCNGYDFDIVNFVRAVRSL